MGWPTMIVTAVIVYYVVFKYLRQLLKYRYYQSQGVTTTYFPMPIVGSLLKFRDLVQDPKFKKLHFKQQNGVIYINDPELSYQILVEKGQFIDREQKQRSQFEQLLGQSLLQLKIGTKYYDRKRMIVEAIHSTTKQELFQTIIRQIHSRVQIWKQFYVEPKKDMELNKQIIDLVSQIIQMTVFGTPNLQKKLPFKSPGKVHELKIAQYMRIISKLLYKRSIRFSRMISNTFDQTFFKDERGLKRNITNFRNRVIEMVKERKILIKNTTKDQNQKESKSSNSKDIDFMSQLIMIKEPDELKTEQIADECIAFMHQSQANLCQFIQDLFEQIITNDSVYCKLKSELDKVFQLNFLRDLNAKQMDKLITIKTLGGLSYLDNVVNETLRMFPPQPFTSTFSFVKDIKINDKLCIKKGQGMQVNIKYLHNEQAYWKDPLFFNPDRFNKDSPQLTLIQNQQQNKSISFCPFSFGQRSCLGQRYTINIAKALVVVIFSLLEFKLLGRKILPYDENERDEVKDYIEKQMIVAVYNM
ncbi:cytochrome p450 [Stylonychia lemnae]|uniref:Cytochrome p450 n=1 Tax=Stylonychia lemnae TaxID=5949 RepID=A0A078B0M5_STYLE|nr:cytochrome p450 [Stylonychia lemnae]|eukprot:CDW86663.1 cytochrome p450 [Stylonychia lemnae]